MKYLFVASTGGHLAQLVRMSADMDASPDSLWITFESPQSLSLLEGRRVEFVPYVKPRDWRGVLRTMRTTRRLLRRESFDLVVSTGAAVALGVFPVAAAMRVPRRYIESVSRIDGPSVTGRIVHASRMAETFTQHPEWSHGRWKPFPSVLTQFTAVDRPVPPEAPLRLFVTLGTIRPYRFDALVDAVLASGLANEHTVWQLGETTRDDLPGRAETQIASAEFDRLAAEADVVVTHAGVGTILALLEMGIHPVVVPRRTARGEHVDDHQAQIARLTDELGVASSREAPALDAATMRAAAGRATIPRQVD